MIPMPAAKSKRMKKEERYRNRVADVANRYTERALDALRRLADTFDAENWVVDDPKSELDGDDTGMRWSFLVYGPGVGDDFLDVALELHASLDYGDDLAGVNFGLHLVHVDGRIVADYTPFNYTRRVWVPADDVKGIEERFVLVTSFDPKRVVRAVVDWYDKNPSTESKEEGE